MSASHVLIKLAIISDDHTTCGRVTSSSQTLVFPFGVRTVPNKSVAVFQVYALVDGTRDCRHEMSSMSIWMCHHRKPQHQFWRRHQEIYGTRTTFTAWAWYGCRLVRSYLCLVCLSMQSVIPDLPPRLLIRWSLGIVLCEMSTGRHPFRQPHMIVNSERTLALSQYCTLRFEQHDVCFHHPIR